MNDSGFPDAETLSAYVDGELLPEQAARIAALIAEDPALAARVSCLHQIKAGVASIAEVSFADLEPQHPPLPTRRNRWRPAAIGGAIAAALALAAFALWPLQPQPSPRTQAAGEAFVERHDTWSARFERGSELPVTPAWLVTAMEATGLRLVHAEPLGETGVHYAFVGSNNCRLSLFEGPATAGADGAFSLTTQGLLLNAHWQTGERAYVMVARNMDGTRFATIAAAVHSASLTRTPPDADLIAVLSAARQRCVV